MPSSDKLFDYPNTSPLHVFTNDEFLYQYLRNLNNFLKSQCLPKYVLLTQKMAGHSYKLIAC